MHQFMACDDKYDQVNLNQNKWSKNEIGNMITLLNTLNWLNLFFTQLIAFDT